MSESYWEQRYRTADMPWEKGEPSPGLVDFITQHPELKRGRVLVPGCGTGHDVRVWAKGGFAATGMDLAPSAIDLAREKTAAAHLSADFVQGDFLRGQPEQPFDWLFEHTLFCAIQLNERDLYVEAVRRWLKPGGNYLAVFYMIDEEDGPPFGTKREELVKRFSPHFNLLKDWVPRSYPNRTGLELMMWWQKK
ncbi:MAG: methyltransferase domain-containing protein [Limisphaerales bacterium]